MLNTPARTLATHGHRPGLARTPGPGVARGMEARIAYARLALRDDRLRLDAQPIVDLHPGEAVPAQAGLASVRRTA